MTARQQMIIDELLNLLTGDKKTIYEKLIKYLIDLGYIPQKHRSYISFVHKDNGKIIAKIRKDDIRIKFFACKNIPDKYIQALRDEVDLSEKKAKEKAKKGKEIKTGLFVPPPDKNPLPTGVIMKKCTLLCNVCTGGKMRYFYEFPDGKETFRCGAYPVLIPDIKENDIDELKRLILEQHNYFLSIA